MSTRLYSAQCWRRRTRVLNPELLVTTARERRPFFAARFVECERSEVLSTNFEVFR